MSKLKENEISNIKRTPLQHGEAMLFPVDEMPEGKTSKVKNAKLDSVLPEVNYERLRYRTMSWKWIYINMACIAIVFAVLNVAVSGTPALLVIPFMAMFG